MRNENRYLWRREEPDFVVLGVFENTIDNKEDKEQEKEMNYDGR